MKDIIIDDIKIGLEGIGWGDGGMDWINLAQDGDKWWVVVNIAMNLQVQ